LYVTRDSPGFVVGREIIQLLVAISAPCVNLALVRVNTGQFFVLMAMDRQTFSPLPPLDGAYIAS